MYPYSYVRYAIIYSTRPGFSITIYNMNLFIQQQLAILLIIDKMNYMDIDWAQISIHNNSHNHIIWLYMILFHISSVGLFLSFRIRIIYETYPKTLLFLLCFFFPFFSFLFFIQILWTQVLGNGMVDFDETIRSDWCWSESYWTFLLWWRQFRFWGIDVYRI